MQAGNAYASANQTVSFTSPPLRVSASAKPRQALKQTWDRGGGNVQTSQPSGGGSRSGATTPNFRALQGAEKIVQYFMYN